MSEFDEYNESIVYKNALLAQRSGNAAGVKFVMHELELGLMHCRMASNAADTEGAQKSESRAKRSHGTALLHVASLFLNADERKAFDEKEGQLRELLAEFAWRNPGN